MHQKSSAPTSGGLICVLASPLYLWAYSHLARQTHPRLAGSSGQSETGCCRRSNLGQFAKVTGPNRTDREDNTPDDWTGAKKKKKQNKKKKHRPSVGPSQRTLCPHKQENHKVEQNQKCVSMQAWNNKWPNHTHMGGKICRHTPTQAHTHKHTLPAVWAEISHSHCSVDVFTV